MIVRQSGSDMPDCLVAALQIDFGIKKNVLHFSSLSFNMTLMISLHFKY